MQMLDELHADGATVCLATHNPRYIARAERHIYLFDGRIVAEPVERERSDFQLCGSSPFVRCSVTASSLAPALAAIASRSALSVGRVPVNSPSG